MTYVFEFQNLYIPEGEVYDSSEFPIRIEPMEGVEEFEENRREHGSQYETGYWRTAKCYIEADEDRAKEFAEWLTYLYSFFQSRDVRWDTYYPEDSPEEVHRVNTYRMPLNNRNIPFITGIQTRGAFFTKQIGETVDVALGTLDDLSREDRTDVIRNISLYLQSEGSSFMMLKFLFLWIVLEANANKHHDRYMKSQGEFLFDEGEQERVREYVLGEFDEDFTDAQLRHLDWLLGRKDIYESSSKVKIVKYVESLEIGFDMDEIEDVIVEARQIRNLLVHSIEEYRLSENSDILTDMRKIVMYVILRELGIGRQMQKRLVTPQIFGPDIELD